MGRPQRNRGSTWRSHCNCDIRQYEIPRRQIHSTGKVADVPGESNLTPREEIPRARLVDQQATGAGSRRGNARIDVNIANAIAENL